MFSVQLSWQFAVGSWQKGKKMDRFKNLKVWQEAHSLVLKIYKITKDFPREEFYGLVDQIRRAAKSIPSNIAEGNGRVYQQEYIRFLYMARGSLYETEYHLLLAKDLGFINETLYKELDEQINLIGKLINGLIRAVREGKNIKNFANRQLQTAN